MTELVSNGVGLQTSLCVTHKLKLTVPISFCPIVIIGRFVSLDEDEM